MLDNSEIHYYIYIQTKDKMNQEKKILKHPIINRNEKSGYRNVTTPMTYED